MSAILTASYTFIKHAGCVRWVVCADSVELFHPVLKVVRKASVRDALVFATFNMTIKTEIVVISA